MIEVGRKAGTVLKTVSLTFQKVYETYLRVAGKASQRRQI